MHENFSDDPARIEAELAQARAALAGTIDNLRDSLKPGTLMDDAWQFARSRMAPMTQTVDRAVRSNPLAAAIAAAGVAWLILGRKGGPSTPVPVFAGTAAEAMSRWEDEGGPPAPFPEADHIWISETDRLRSRASAALADLDAAGRMHLRPAADLARERAAIVADTAATTTQAMMRGLESLPVGARQRVLDARRRAYAAKSSKTSKGTSLIEDHPLIAAAIAVAAGVALAKALPLTDVENRLLGPERDRLMEEARSILAQECTRLAGDASVA
jgi:ElaB/YqjD/DUF883 family membrane-anchored ribosome-binding protein